jgi:1,4-dihydroxy-2-naphthoyl-CoA hydrolase
MPEAHEPDSALVDSELADSELTGGFRASMPFAKALGIEVLTASPEEVRVRSAWEERLCTAGGILHGGALMGIADAAGAYSAFLNLPDGATGTATIESKTNFFRAVRDGHVVATSRPLHRGRTTIVVETDLHDADGRHVARVTQTQAVLAG